MLCKICEAELTDQEEKKPFLFCGSPICLLCQIFILFNCDKIKRIIKKRQKQKNGASQKKKKVS